MSAVEAVRSTGDKSQGRCGRHPHKQQQPEKAEKREKRDLGGGGWVGKKGNKHVRLLFKKELSLGQN